MIKAWTIYPHASLNTRQTHTHSHHNIEKYKIEGSIQDDLYGAPKNTSYHDSAYHHRNDSKTEPAVGDAIPPDLLGP